MRDIGCKSNDLRYISFRLSLFLRTFASGLFGVSGLSGLSGMSGIINKTKTKTKFNNEEDFYCIGTCCHVVRVNGRKSS